MPAEHVRGVPIIFACGQKISRRRPRRRRSPSRRAFSVDDRVEVKIKIQVGEGQGQAHAQGRTLDVDASNGEKARRVDAEDARARDDGSDGDDAKIGVGDKVRAKYKVRDPARKLNLTPSTRVSRRVRSTQGRAKEYDGVIKEAHSDGTSRSSRRHRCPLQAPRTRASRWRNVVIDATHSPPDSRRRYDDGEIETYVNKKFITVTRAKSRSRSRSKSDDSRSKKKRRDRSRSSSSSRSRGVRSAAGSSARATNARRGSGASRLPSTDAVSIDGKERHRRAGTTKARCLASIRTAL